MPEDGLSCDAWRIACRDASGFDNHGGRVFITDMVTLGKTDEPAPNKPAKGRRKKAVKVEAEGADEA